MKQLDATTLFKAPARQTFVGCLSIQIGVCWSYVGGLFRFRTIWPRCDDFCSSSEVMGFFIFQLHFGHLIGLC